MERHRTDLGKPFGLFLFLLGGKAAAQISEREGLLILVVRLGFRLKRPVVHSSATSERTGEFCLLRLIRIDPVPICAFDLVCVMALSATDIN